MLVEEEAEGGCVGWGAEEVVPEFVRTFVGVEEQLIPKRPGRDRQIEVRSRAGCGS